MKEIAIKDLYAGKPDARDEVTFDGLEGFIKTFVVAEHFDIDSLLNGTNCFICGFKGTGKTALLLYLDSKLQEEDAATCSSFIFFKEDYTDSRRNELQAISHRILSSISVDSSALLDCEEFEYIWKWLFFKRIVSDNEEYNRQLFEDDDAWRMFEKVISRIKDPKDARKIHIPNRIKLSVPVKDAQTMTEVAPEVEIDLQQASDKYYKDFLTLIDKAEEMFSKVTRTDIPYYILVDELEAYYGEERIFKRDLRLIRDLLFTVKRFNTIFSANKFKKTKVICSVRSEIINAISRFVVSKEINKITSGFSLPLNWNYTNSNSYAHPIIQILLRRIAVCSESEDVDSYELYQKWFPEKIHGIEPANYILNNSWCKPRDMVRLISTAQNSLQRDSGAFTQIVFATLLKAYSEDSLMEIKEELRALYSAEEIDCIISCFTGFRTVFSVSDLKTRIEKYYSGTILGKDLNRVLNDLYRLGFLGNFLPVGRVHHWQHKGDSSLILADEWRLCIHYALHSALSLGAKSTFALSRHHAPQVGDVAKACVYQVMLSFALVQFELYGEKYNGRIHIAEFKKLGYGYIERLNHIVSKGDEFDIVVNNYCDQHECWNLGLIAEPDQQCDN